MNYTLIHNGTVINGTGSEPITQGAVLIQDNQIKAVGHKQDIPLPQAEIRMIDAQGGAILPGMIDTHVHLMLEGVNLMQMTLAPFSLMFFEAIERMERTIEAGVTTVRDAGGTDLGVKTAVNKGLVVGPRIQLSITMLSITGGHGDGWMPSGLEIPLFRKYPGMPKNICDGVAGVRKKVRQVLRAGADVVKLCSTGGAVSPTDHPRNIQFSLPELQAAVEEAHFHQKKKVMAHALDKEGIKNAVLAGVHSIEHGLYLDDEVIELMLERGTYLVPTLLAIVGGLEYAAQANSLPDYAIEKARDQHEIHADNIAKAVKAGVKIAMGTDAGVFPHGWNLRECELMCRVGMSPMDSIVASTKTAAECLGWEDRIGTLEAGKLADVIVTDGDPLADVSLLKTPANIKLVIKDGTVLKDTF